jgi:hypothetical protein
MPKKKDWTEKLGKYTSDDPGLTRDESGLGYPKPKDISKVVDGNHKANDGYVGPLKSQE